MDDNKKLTQEELETIRAEVRKELEAQNEKEQKKEKVLKVLLALFLIDHL